MNHMNQQRAFTMTELIIVIIMLGIIASYALPNYRRSIERAHERDMEAQLRAIHGANLIYRAQNGGQYWPPDGLAHDVTEINSNLGINVIENGFTIACSSPDPGNEYDCTALRDDFSFSVTVRETPLSATNPGCGGTCP